MTINESLTYTNELGESITFSLRSVFCPQDVTGLTDVKSTIYSINSMGQSGDTFVASRIEARDIDIAGVIKERNPDKLRAYRRQLARILNPQLSATLTYRYKDFVRVIGCRSVNAPEVTRKERSVFSDFSVQLSCLNPFWREESVTQNDIAAWVGAFEFPIEIPALALDGTGGMELGYRLPSLIVNVHNGGDVETGLKLEFRAMEAVTNPSILNVTTGEQIRIIAELEEGDTLIVSTGYGEKWATLTHDGATTDALWQVDITSTFLQLQPGDNLIRYDAEDGLQNLEVSIYHSNLYLGV